MKQTIFSSTIRSLRRKSDYTQADVSSKLNIQRQTYSNYENACRTPPLEIIVALAKLYHVSIDYLVLGADSVREKSARELRKDKLFDEFTSLSRNAQKEVLDFIRFKKAMQAE